MTSTEETESAPEVQPETSVMFMDREIWVKRPRPEQVLVWQRTIKSLTEAPVNTAWTGDEVMRALERLRMIFDSILVNRADINWLDDRFLDGTVGFKELTPILNQVIAAFNKQSEENAPNREARRAAAKPAKKAARKKKVTP